MPRNTMPTSLLRLQEVINTIEDDGGDGYQAIEAVLPDAKDWLEWTLDFLSNRKALHAKARIKNKLLVQAAKQMLGPDEIDAIEQRAEEQLVERIEEPPVDLGQIDEEVPDA